MTETRRPVVFIHGLFLHATTWGPWVELFTEAGYDAVAPLIVTVETAEAAAGAATPSTPATANARERRRIRFI